MIDVDLQLQPFDWEWAKSHYFGLFSQIPSDCIKLPYYDAYFQHGFVNDNLSTFGKVVHTRKYRKNVKSICILYYGIYDNKDKS